MYRVKGSLIHHDRTKFPTSLRRFPRPDWFLYPPPSTIAEREKYQDEISRHNVPMFGATIAAGWGACMIRPVLPCDADDLLLRLSLPVVTYIWEADGSKLSLQKI